jgi:uncharacterized membrane protein
MTTRYGAADAGRAWPLAAVLAALSLGGGACRAAAPQEGTEQRPLPARVRAVFARKCAACHGRQLRSPLGRFGYVLDLKRLASNPQLVAPFKPDESTLWALIRDGEMPPDEADTGPLSRGQKALIHNWIAAGAPAAGPPQPAAVSATAPAEEATAAGSTGGAGSVPAWKRLLRWLGKFHLLVLHFPIALILTAAAVEGWCVVRGARVPSPVVRCCLVLGAVGGVAAAGLGWLLADFGHYGGGSRQLLGLHRWLGTLAGVSVVGLAVLSEAEVRRGRRTWFFRLLLGAGAGLVGLAAHLGGTLAHGEAFFRW